MMQETVFNRIGGHGLTSVSYFREGVVASVGENEYICNGKPTKDPEKACFVTNFVTPRNNNVGFLLPISQLESNIKTKPDSLTSQGLPGINTAKVVLSFDLNKFCLIKDHKASEIH